MKLCLLLIIGLIATCQSVLDSRKQYMIDFSQLVRFQIDIKTCKIENDVSYGHFVHQDRYWVVELNNFFQQIETLIDAFGEIVYNNFNENYVESLIQSILQNDGLNQEDQNTIKSVKIVTNFNIKLDKTFLQLHSSWKEAVKTGTYNFLEFETVSPHLAQQYFVKLDTACNKIENAIKQIKSMPLEIKTDLEIFMKRTESIIAVVLKIADILQSNTDPASKKIHLEDRFFVLKGLLRHLNEDASVKRLNEFTNQIQRCLSDADDNVKYFRNWFEDLIVFNPIYQYSDLKEFWIAMSVRKTKRGRRSATSDKAWKRTMYDKIFPLADKILERLSVRILNLSSAYIDGIIALIKTDKKNQKISNEIVTLLKSYKELYKPAKLEEFLKPLNYDYIQLFGRQKQRITTMEKDESDKLEKLMQDNFESLEKKQNLVNVTELEEFRRPELEISDTIRMEDLFELKLFYKQNVSDQKLERLNALKSNLEKRINAAKRLNADYNDAIKTILKSLKESLLVTFKEMLALPQQLESFLGAAPGQGKIK